MNLFAKKIVEEKFTIPNTIHIGDKSYGMNDLVTKKVGMRITGLGKTTFDREVRRGHLNKMSFGSSQQAKVMFLVKDLINYRNKAYKKTITHTGV